MGNQRIGNWQGIFLLVTSRLFNVLNYIPAFLGQSEGMSLIYGTLFSFAEQVILVIPVLILYKKHDGKSVITICNEKSRIFGKIVIFIFFLDFLAATIGGISGFTYFMVNAVYPEALTLTIVISITAVCVFCTRDGIQGIARASTLLFIFFIIGLLVIFAVGINSVKLLNFHPNLENPINSIVRYTFDITAKSTELLALMLLLPIINGSKAKCTYWFLGITFLISMVINFLIIGILGDFAFSQTFPYFTITSVVEMKFFQRLDSIHMISWVFVSFVHITLFAGFSVKLLKSLLPKAVKKPNMICRISLFIVCSGASIYLCYASDLIKKINMQSSVILTVLLFLLPLILNCFSKSHKKPKGDSENVENGKTDITDAIDAIH